MTLKRLTDIIIAGLAATLFGATAYFGVFKSLFSMNDFLIIKTLAGIFLLAVVSYVIRLLLNKQKNNKVPLVVGLFFGVVLMFCVIGIAHGEIVLKNIVEVIDYPHFDNYENYTFSEGLTPVCRNQKYGYMNERGAVTIELIYDEAGMFSCGRAKVCMNGKYGYIDRTGKGVIKCDYTDVSDFSDDVASVENENGEWGLIYCDGTCLPFDYNEIGNQRLEFHEGYAAFIDVETGLYGYVNRSGNIVVPAIYAEAFDVFEGVAFVSDVESRNKLINMDGKEFDYAFDIPYGANFRQGNMVAYRYVEGTGVLIDREGMIILEFPEGVNLIQPLKYHFSYMDTASRKYGCIDSSGKIVIKPIFDWIGPSMEGITKILYNGKTYYVRL